MLTPQYDLMLVLASVAVSVMASFTGLTLTRGISALPDTTRKLLIVMASLSLGGGIWCMHFVAMLAMRLPVPISYDAANTLGSVLIAILMSGVALLIMHYSARTLLHMAIAGAVLGNGIVAMHYLGMSGIRGCMPTFQPAGLILAVLGATATGILAIWVSYSKRTTRHIFAGAIIFGLSVVLVHFVAMGWTNFQAGGVSGDFTPIIENGTLALVVMLSAFVICGTFLLTATTFLLTGEAREAAVLEIVRPVAVLQTDGAPRPKPPEQAGSDFPLLEKHKLPFERDKRIYFIEPAQVAAIRAEGHYTIIHTADDKLFCPLSITEVEKRLQAGSFIRTHRSYLVNIERVTAFERAKDSGRCLFEGVTSLKFVPVSRSFVPRVRTALNI
jgi:NO-binding membrane sensor protein with MHYT domain